MDRKLASILVLLLCLSQALSQMDQDMSSPEEMDEAVDISSRILDANRGISRTLMEGDVAMPRSRNAMKCYSFYDCRWEKSPTGLVEVPYNINDYFLSHEKVTIEKAMNTFHEKTCIRFVPYTTQVHHLSIESKSGCYSSVGRTGGKQTVSLNAYRCLYPGVIQHELLHALGFHHEHTRSDRDKYIRINWEHVPNGASSNFAKRDTNNLNTTYDYSSLMHYGKYSFTSSFGKATIIPIPDPEVTIGQRTDLSETDIFKLNKIYKCDEQ
ncbi:hatching enzyme 1.2-like [Clupea harengus]|uniref:Metalloendopeptidase n=1 Tax=Clupea harengus TaxID=7950 RepID=A0A6P8EPW5_CLUHA|nr:hatching enzyme 1.2-like [Clupea harengus]